MGYKWKKEELEYLEENWGSVSIGAMSKRLGRTINGIRAKAIRLGLGSQMQNSDVVSFNILINTLGYKECYSWMKQVAERYNCPVRTKKLITREVKVVKLEEFWKWAEKHQDILNFKDFVPFSLGAEPKWVNVKRERDRNSLEKMNRNRLWTEEEVNLLIAKVKSQRHTYAQLAADFRRTESAIHKKLCKLKVPDRPIPRDNKIFWTLQENELLLKLHKEGYSISQIAQQLNKSQLSIGERIKLLEVQGARKFKYNNLWTNEEIEYLSKHWNTRGINELSLELDRSKHAISKKASRIGLEPKFTKQARS